MIQQDNIRMFRRSSCAGTGRAKKLNESGTPIARSGLIDMPVADATGTEAQWAGVNRLGTALAAGPAMDTDNVIYVDFRFSKDIRDRQAISFAQRIKESSQRTRDHLHAARSALEQIKAKAEKRW